MKESTKRCRGTLRIAASTRSSRAALPSSSLARSTWIPMTSTICRRRICEMRFAHRLHGNALHSCWSWFARPASRDVLTQETECSPQLARLTAGHTCMRGDYVRRPDLPVIPTTAMVPLGDLQTVYGVDRARLLPTASAREARNHGADGSRCWGQPRSYLTDWKTVHQ